MMPEQDKSHPIKSTKGEFGASIVSAVVSAAPYLGGPVSNVINGFVVERRLNRVGEVLEDLSRRVASLEDQSSIDYVKTEEFEDLLEMSLQKASWERSEEKRRAYASLIARGIECPEEGYDEKIRMLKVLEDLQPDHIRLLKAILEDPPSDVSVHGMTSPGRVLCRRTGMDKPRIDDLVAELDRLRVTNMDSLNSSATPRGAEQTSGFLTDFGRKFVAYILVEPQDLS